MNLSLIYEYEMVLLDKKLTISSFFFNQSPQQNEKMALDVIRYAVEKYLKWSPTEMVEKFNADVIKQMKLDSIMRFILFPPEADEKRDYFVIAHKLYPKQVKLNNKEMSLMVYRRVLNGELYKFPKGFFDGSMGRYRAIICLQYVLAQKRIFNCSHDVYQAFASPRGTKLLKDYKLQAARMTMWNHAIDYVHDALPDINKDEFWYRYYKFKIMDERQRREMLDAGTFIA